MLGHAMFRGHSKKMELWTRSLAAVCDSPPPSTVITDYAIGLEKLSANESFFAGAQTAVSFNRQLRLYQAFLL